jgi:hypothetical protein
MSKIAKKVVFTSLSPTLTTKHVSDNIFKILMGQKIKNKILKSGDTMEVVVFGKKCQFRLEEVVLNSGIHNGEKIVITEDTTIVVFVEGEVQPDQDLEIKRSKSFIEQITPNPYDEENSFEKSDICEEVGLDQVNELHFTFKFNMDENIDQELKMKNVVVCGNEKSGKKTIVRRAVTLFLRE